MPGRILCNKLLRCFCDIKQSARYSSAVPKLRSKQGPLLISCKRKDYNYYLGTHYDKLDEVPLASKGWNHSKSKNDYFTVLPIPTEYDEDSHLFTEFGIHNLVIDRLKTQGIEKATEFQSRAIPTIHKGVHTLLAAETGCGKTISYILPIIQGIINSKSENLNTPKAVIIVPNRELAYQAGEMAKLLCDPVGVAVKILVGGRTKQMMMNPTFNEVDIVVATPGVLGKLSTVGIYKLNEVRWLVLDEADTLIDDSFIERMEGLVKRMAQAQLILVSATLPRKLPDMLAPYEQTMEQVISPKLHKPLLNITQQFRKMTKSMKPANLLQIAKVNKDPMLIFTNRNQTCNWLAMFLRENDIPCANINGDMNYAIRIEQWNQFVRGEAKILSATDVGSRGLNTIQVKHVLNYDFPLYMADYIHRIGRVGRLGSPQNCKVTNFICGPEEVSIVQQIELSIRRNQALTNVDGNITNIVQNKILRKIREGS